MTRNLSYEGKPDPLGRNPFPIVLGLHMPYEDRIGEFAAYERSHIFFSDSRSDGFTQQQALEVDASDLLKNDLRSHTGEFLASRAVGEFQMWPWPQTPRTGYGDDSVVPYPLLMLLHLVVLSAGIIGLLRLRRQPLGLIGLSILVALFALHLLYVALPRYVLMAIPFLLVGAAFSLTQLWDSRGARLRQRLTE